MFDIVNRSLGDQGFRLVHASAFTGQVLDLARQSDVATAALSPVVGDPNWRALSYQLSSYVSPGFQGLWLRGSGTSLGVAISYLWSGELAFRTASDYFDHLWTITRTLRSYLGNFTLQGGNLEVLENLAKGLIPAPADVTAIADAIFSLHFARTPRVVLILSAQGGLHEDLVSLLSRNVANPFHKSELMTFAVTPTSQVAVGVDGRDGSVYGVIPMGYPFRGDDFHRSLQFYR